MSAQLGQAIYIGACFFGCALTLALILANVFYVGGGLLPDIGALLVGGVIWLAGRTAKTLLSMGSVGTNPK